MERKLYIPRDTAIKASRYALNEAERLTGCKIRPVVKGELCKHVAGIISRLEMIGDKVLTHEGAEKTLSHNRFGKESEASAPRFKRRKINRIEGGQS